MLPILILLEMQSYAIIRHNLFTFISNHRVYHIFFFVSLNSLSRTFSYERFKISNSKRKWIYHCQSIFLFILSFTLSLPFHISFWFIFCLFSTKQFNVQWLHSRFVMRSRSMRKNHCIMNKYNVRHGWNDR